MKLTLEAKTVAGGVLLLLVLLGTGYLNFFQRFSAIDARTALIQLHEVGTQLQAVDALLDAGATMQSSYLSTRDDRFVEPYVRASARIKTLQEMTAEDKEQNQRLNQLASKVNEELTELRNSVKTRRGLQSDRSKALTGEINSLITQIDSVHNQRLKDQTNLLQQESDKTFSALLLMMTMGTLGIALTMSFLYRMLKGREEIEQRLRERGRIAGFIANTNRALTETDSVPEMLRRCSEHIVGYFNTAFAGIWLYDERDQLLYLHGKAGPASKSYALDKPLSLGASNVGVVAEQRRPHLFNASTGEVPHGDLKELPRGLTSFAGHPLIFQDKLVGVMAIFDRRKLGDEVFISMASVADSIALGIERRAMVTRLQEKELDLSAALEHADLCLQQAKSDIMQRERVERRLAMQYAVTKSLNEATTIAEATNGMHRNVCETMGWSLGTLWMVDQESDVLRCADIWHVEELEGSEFIRENAFRTFGRKVGLPGRVWESGEPEWIGDVEDAVNFPRIALAKEDGLGSAVAFPIKFGSEIIGVSEFFSRKIEEPDEELLHSFTNIGTALGQYMERKRVEEQGQRTQSQVDAIISSMGEGLYQVDLFSTIVFVNRHGADLLGYEFAALEGRNVHDVLHNCKHEGSVGEENCPIMKVITDGVAFKGSDEVLICADKTEMPIDCVCTPVLVNGEITGAIVCFRDIAERKEAERRVSEFYSTVSHELRTPLTSIRGSLGLIEGGLAGDVTEKTLFLVNMARSESDRLIRLINDILDIRKIEAGKMELRKSIVDAHHLVVRTIEGIRGMAHNAGVELKAKLGTSGSLECDEDRMIQVITNLVSNAIKYSPRDGVVTVRLDPATNNTIRFSIIDKGPGIAQKHMHKLFGKFQQVDSSDSRKKEGTGLGLAITKAIVEQHGGTVGVHSVVGEGSTFWFEVPYIANPKKEFPSTALTSGRHPALLIDDDDNIATVLTAHLEKDGFDVVRATSLREANAVLEKVRPIVIILDLNLPDGNGLQLFHQLQADEHRKGIPVIVVTASRRDESLNSKALIEWITKPFDEKQLHHALDRAMEFVGPATVLLVENDASTREVIRRHIEGMGAICLEAADGAEALSQFRHSNPDLIVLDLGIPAPDGFAVVEILKGETNGLKPLIVYTALDLDEEQRDRLQLGMTAHLTKSRNTQEELIATVREFLNGLLLGKRRRDAAGDGKSGDGKSGDGKSGEGKSGEGKSGEGKSGEGRSSANTSNGGGEGHDTKISVKVAVNKPSREFVLKQGTIDKKRAGSGKSNSPTQSPTESPTQSPTESPAQSPTESPAQSPAESPAQSAGLTAGEGVSSE